MRLDILEMVCTAGSGHIDSSFSVVDILTVLYFETMQVKPDSPSWSARDRLVLSKGHAAPALYACLARKGFFPSADLAGLRKIDSHLQGHSATSTPGVDASTGSLGQGLSIATGLAFAASIDRTADRAWRVFAVLSDGELNEGQTWEALMLAPHLRLTNLTVIVDVNGLQYTGRTRDVLALPNLKAAFTALGWTCVEVDGHSPSRLTKALAVASDRPTIILAKTVKGRGVSFMEDNLYWHGRVPNESERTQARFEIARLLA